MTSRACRCLPGPLPSDDTTCLKCGKPLAFDHEESVRNRKIAEHSMKSRRRQDAGLRASFARQQAIEDAKKADLSLFNELMEQS